MADNLRREIAHRGGKPPLRKGKSMSEQDKGTWGGRREGSGRKHGSLGKEKSMEIVYFRLPPEVAAEAARRAEKEGITRSKYLRNLILSFFEKKVKN